MLRTLVVPLDGSEEAERTLVCAVVSTVAGEALRTGRVRVVLLGPGAAAKPVVQPSPAGAVRA